jgi:hypothetical protein
MDKDPAEIVATLRRSIEASQRGSRRLRAHRFKDLFGFQAWSPARRESVGRLLSDEGIVVQPALEQAGRDDWLVFSIPAPGVTSGAPPEPRPTAKWFAHLAELRLGSELEVEMHFVSPLFERLGYREEQEAVGFGFVMWEGVRQHHAEADLLYFAGTYMTSNRAIPSSSWNARQWARVLMLVLARPAATPSGLSRPTTWSPAAMRPLP